MTNIQNDKNVMIQSNSMIDNRGNWGTTGNRLYYSILKRIDANAETIPVMEIPISEVLEEWGLSRGKTYERICEEAKRLIKQCYTIIQYDNSGTENSQTVGTFFSQIQVRKNESVILVELNKQVEKDLIQLKKNFTKTEFGILALLTRGTSQRLYDLLMEYKGLGKRVFRARELERRIKPHADDAKPYDRPNKIEEKLVIPAVDEINEKTNLNITFQKFGRGEDTHYEFTIKEKKTDNSKPAKLTDNVAEVIHHLNKVTGHRFSTGAVHTELNARLKENSVELCKKVIDFKYNDWAGWDGRSKAMNPTTLFRKGNFGKYVEEMKARGEDNKPTGLPTDIPGVMDDGYINLELAREAVAQGRRWYKDPSGMIVNF